MSDQVVDTGTRNSKLSRPVGATMFHKSADGIWRRCTATARHGQNVEFCPLFTNGVHVDRRLIALLGGGDLERDGVLSKVSKFHPDKGYYAVEGKNGQVQIFDPQTNERITWVDRRDHPELLEEFENEAPYYTPPEDFYRIYDDEHSEDAIMKTMRMFNDDRFGGVKLEKLKKDQYEAIWNATQFVSKQRTLSDKDRNHFQQAMIFHLMVGRKPLQEAVQLGFKQFAEDKRKNIDNIVTLIQTFLKEKENRKQAA